MKCVTAGWAAAAAGAAVLLLACAPAPVVRPPVARELPRSDLAAVDSAMPEQIGAFRRIERRRLNSPARDFAYRFRDSAGVGISVYVYPIDYAGGESTGDARTRVEHEGRVFFEVMPIQVQRGIYDSFETLVARADSAVVAGTVVPAFISGVRVRRRGSTLHEIQYLHLVGGDFVKVRSTIADVSLLSVLQAFDSALVQRLGGR